LTEALTEASEEPLEQSHASFGAGATSAPVLLDRAGVAEAKRALESLLVARAWPRLALHRTAPLLVAALRLQCRRAQRERQSEAENEGQSEEPAWVRDALVHASMPSLLFQLYSFGL